MDTSDTMGASTRATDARPGAAKIILVAENDESNRLLMQQMLAFGGYACILTSNGREALDALERGPVDLALLDLSMPVLDGYHAAAQIRGLSNGATLPLVAVTAHASEADRELALRSGFTEYLTKPFSQRALLALVARLLGERSI
jgi:CheY-like chemotaxis protein